MKVLQKTRFLFVVVATFFICSIFFSGISIPKAYGYACSEYSNNQGTPVRIYKVGGFSSPEELRAATVLITPSFQAGCLLGKAQRISLSGAQVAQDDDGTYYTNIDLSKPNSDVPEECYPLTITIYSNSDLLNNYCKFDISSPSDVTVPFNLCNTVPEGEKRDECLACVGVTRGENAKKIWTALGCITVDESKGKYGAGIITALVKIGLGLAGGALLLMILAAAFLLSSSQGDPKKTDEAQKMITAGIVGLLFIIFSVVILRTIGIDILQIPGF